jgi:putative membrane protein
VFNHVLAAVHLCSLACGVAVLFQRAAALRDAEDERGLPRVFFWDNLAGLVAIVWIGSGLWRLLGGHDKGLDYYLSNWVFWLKLGLILVVVAVECVPMITFIRWRVWLAKGQPVSLARRDLYVRLHWVEFAGMLLAIVCASAMARGIGVPTPSARAAGSEGERVYAQYCAACHQLDGRGLNGKLAADFVAGARLEKPDDALLRSIAEGVPGSAMPAFGGVLSEAQRRAVLRHVRERFGKEPRPQAVPATSAAAR